MDQLPKYDQKKCSDMRKTTLELKCQNKIGPMVYVYRNYEKNTEQTGPSDSVICGRGLSTGLFARQYLDSC